MPREIEKVHVIELVDKNTLKYQLANNDGINVEGTMNLDIYIENLDGKQPILV